MRRNKFKTRRKFERLEDRRMMAGIDVENDILQITGSENPDLIVIEADPEDDDNVRVTITDLTTGQILAQVDEDDDIEFEDDFDQIEVHALGGSDIVMNLTDVDAKLFGEGGDDTLSSGDGADEFDGGLGNDIMTGGAGNDTYSFDGLNLGTDEINEAANVGTDTLDFTNFQSFVSVDLERVFSPSNPSFAVSAFMSNLKVKLFDATGIENVKGSALTDTIKGNSRNNHFWGGDENDKLEGRRGNDILEGEAGNDTYEFGGTNLGTDDIFEAANSGDDRLRFSGMESGVTVDISKAGTQFAVDSADLRLRLANDTAIESIFGSRFGDTITGNSRNNNLRGLDGNDTIRGGAGVDILNGGADDDTLLSDALDEAVFGGTGRDRFDNFFFYESVVDTRNGIPARFKDLGLI